VIWIGIDPRWIACIRILFGGGEDNDAADPMDRLLEHI
jgi:hypothetical protein